MAIAIFSPRSHSAGMKECAMKILTLPVLVLCAALVVSHPASGEGQGGAQSPRCETGPVSRTFGNTKWLVYSCDDDRSLVIASAPDNPASPFYFTFFPDGDHYRLHGEGAGSKAEAADAFKEIQRLSRQDVLSLIAAAKAQGATPVTQ
jgi:hypothetical protein